MSAVYDKMGLRFEYPENWRIEDEEAGIGASMVTVCSPEGAFWSVSIQSGDSEPNDMTQAAVEAMRQEYEDLDAEPTAETVEDRTLTGFDLSFILSICLCPFLQMIVYARNVVYDALHRERDFVFSQIASEVLKEADHIFVMNGFCWQF